jgi:nitroimidazol reductase NimA-like FMN-containing flavoprotein (pyridoxamine 5'-phosphate oxidase superfamily)
MKELRKKDKKLDFSSAEKILKNGEYGILSTSDKQSTPYGIPLSYVYNNNSVFFHCAIEGHKIENIKFNPKVCFSVVGKTKVLPSRFTTDYESVVIFGKAYEIEGEEKIKALRLLSEKYSSGYEKEGEEEIRKHGAAAKVIKIDINHMSGKASKKEIK